MIDINLQLFEKAYKKLKSSVYFDKTQLVLRNKVVEFENSENFEKSIKDMYESFRDEKKFNTLCNEILSSITILSFPKKLKDNKSDIIINSAPKNIEVDELQHFINMDVRGHILGVLWLMLIGYKIDKQVYKHSYGNRIRKKLLNEISENPTYSPYLFEPYFEQYESWRDTAMTEAARHLGLDEDIVIITMDFKRFYYSVDMNEFAFDKMFNEANNDEANVEALQQLNRLNQFISDVVTNYSIQFDTKLYKGRHILPIGFLPSNVLANWCLKNFDKAIVDGWNPVYYGRYVDDILIVDKVEHNSDIYNEAKNSNLTQEKIIEFFLKQCSKWNGVSNTECNNSQDFALLQIDEDETKQSRNKVKKKSIKVFRINSKYNAISGDKSKIIVQNDKVKIFYFKSGESDALISCFKEKISKNKSEFRQMPEDEAFFQRDDYNEIFVLKNTDTINKFRGVECISIDKFELSKFLGKQLRIGGLIQDRIESRFEKDVLKIFNTRVIIENYTLWEKVIEIFVINERFDAVKKFIKKVIDSIAELKYKEKDRTANIHDIQESLYLSLHSVICRSFSLVWKPEATETLNTIYKEYMQEQELFRAFCCETSQGLYKERQAYCTTRMLDKSVMPIIIDMICKSKVISELANVNLTRFYEVLEIANEKWKVKYKYYPCMVTMYDFAMISCVKQIINSNEAEYIPFDDLKMIYDEQTDYYVKCNYNMKDSYLTKKQVLDGLVDVKAMEIDEKAFKVTVGNTRKSKLRIAIANVALEHKNFEMLVKGSPNRSYLRYRDISYVINQSIDQKVDMLIMPESFVPYEWLSTMARTCARNNLAIVTGVEHIKYKNKVFNLSVVILPYSEDGYKCAYMSFHLKKHYAPSEIQEIRGYRLTEVKGTHYELYKWNDCYFPVYCCYELASIKDRSLFQSYADMLVAVEWNRDTIYYSNILESLSRDIHCYCIQVNSSNYGDSRITKPSKSEEKDIIRTKGGINNTILVDEIDIGALRNFQLKEYELQSKNNQFKATPPEFDTEIILAKIKGFEI